MIDNSNFLFRPSARFFKRNLKDGAVVPVTKAFIEDLFSKLSINKDGQYRHIELKANEKVGSHPLFYSICVFVKKNSPTFLSPKAKKINEVYAYAMLIEFPEYVVISASNVQFTEYHLRNIAIEVDHDTLSRCFINEKTSIEKLETESMDGSDNAIRTRSVTALNLQNSWAPTIAGRQLIGAMRVRRDQISSTINPATARLYDSTSAKSFAGFFDWAWQKVFQIRSFKKQAGYLDNFAQSLSFLELNTGRNPSSTLISGWKLIEPLDGEAQIDSCYSLEKDDEIPIETSQLAGVFDRVFKLIKKDSDDDSKFNLIHPDDPDDIVSDSKDNILLKIRRGIVLRKNRNSFSIYSPILTQVKVKMTDDSEQTLAQFINRQNAFQVTYDDPTAVYWSGKPFRDPGIGGRLASFMTSFKPTVGLELMKDEKGDARMKKTDTKFKDDCLFGFIENNVELGKDADFLICDDLGDEWADYIAIKDGKYIKFIHAKHNDDGISASAFQEVVAQAIKNLGNMNNLPEMDRKKTNWKTPWNGTKVNRLRKGSNMDDAIEAYRRTVARPNADKEVCLVIDFVSHKRLETEMKLFVEKKSKEYQLQQMFWLITTFIAACLDSATKPKIYCPK